MKRVIMICAGCISTGLGFLGVFLPVLPTTPFLLLAAFLFSGSSERISNWLQETKVYKAYVDPFKRDEGLTKKKKAQILCTTYAVMLVSGIIVRQWHAIAFMTAVAIWLFWYIGFHIKTVESGATYEIAREECIEDVRALLDDGQGEPAHKTCRK